MPLAKNRNIGKHSRKHKTFKLDGVKDSFGNLVGIRKVGISSASMRMNRPSKIESATRGYEKIMALVDRAVRV